MSGQREIFYNLFWKNKACRELFLLSKDELLDTHTFTVEGQQVAFPFPRIILSNLSYDPQGKEQHRFRTETQALLANRSFQAHLDRYQPQIEAFFESKFGKSFRKLAYDFEHHAGNLLSHLLALAAAKDQDEVNQVLLQFLKAYGFVGNHIKSLDELEQYVQREAIAKNLRALLTENNFLNFSEILRSIKDLYWTETLKAMANSNQVLVNALYDRENFESRLHLFDLLYDQKIITSSEQEAFLECHQCDPGQYRGMMQLRIRPSRTPKLLCPVCGTPLSFYIPYDIDSWLFEVIRSQDGLLLDAIAWKAKELHCDYKLNFKDPRLTDIEVDCAIRTARKRIIIESKMYRRDIGERKFLVRMKSHAGKLHRDAEEIRSLLKNKFEVVPIMVVNISDAELLAKVRAGMKDPVQILTLDELEKVLPGLIKDFM